MSKRVELAIIGGLLCVLAVVLVMLVQRVLLPVQWYFPGL